MLWVFGAVLGCSGQPGDTQPGSASGRQDQHAAGQLQFAYVTNGTATFWTIAEAGAQAAARDFNVACEVRMPTEGIAHQKQIIEDLLTRGVDGIAVSPIVTRLFRIGIAIRLIGSFGTGRFSLCGGMARPVPSRDPLLRHL